jgi:hypothetical protein
MPETTDCVMIDEHGNQCKTPSSVGDMCIAHRSMKCVICGAKAVKLCRHGGLNKCKKPLCSNNWCRVTHNEIAHRD